HPGCRTPVTYPWVCGSTPLHRLNPDGSSSYERRQLYTSPTWFLRSTSLLSGPEPSAYTSGRGMRPKCNKRLPGVGTSLSSEGTTATFTRSGRFTHCRSQGALPNKGLKLAGAVVLREAVMFVPWRARDIRPPHLRQRAGRPQLKREPVSSAPHGHGPITIQRGGRQPIRGIWRRAARSCPDWMRVLFRSEKVRPVGGNAGPAPTSRRPPGLPVQRDVHGW